MNAPSDSPSPEISIQKKRIGASQEASKRQEDFSPEKVLYVEIDDEITGVFDRLKRLRHKKIAIVIPKRAAVLQSVVNLKVLKKKLDELDKEIVLVTADPAGMALSRKAGFTAAPRLFERTEDKPIHAPLPPLRGERPVRIAEGRLSLAEVIREEKPRLIAGLIGTVREKWKKRRMASGKIRVVLVAPNKQALFTLILVGIFLLLSIAYIALPGATITLIPASNILDSSHNITFLDASKNRAALENPSQNNIVIGSSPVRPPPVVKTFTRPATGKTFEGQNARGTITVINLSNAPWDLAAKTRFQTESGVIFRTPSAVRIPAARGNAPGTLDVPVAADAFDENGQVVGEKGNILPSKFFLPGLKNEENRKKLYGESRAPMAGGVTLTSKIVRKEDLEAAREFVKSEVKKSASADLKKYLEEQNFQNKTHLTLLDDRHVIAVSEPTIAIPEDLIGKKTERFDVTATYTVSGIGFDREKLSGMLKERLMARGDPDKKIIDVDENDLSYKFLDQDENAGRVRLTATIRAIQISDLDPEKDNGRRFMKKISDHIAGMRTKDALAYLQQQTGEIARVEIKTWPVWAPTIPSIAENIKFVIKESSMPR